MEKDQGRAAAGLEAKSHGVPSEVVAGRVQDPTHELPDNGDKRSVRQDAGMVRPRRMDLWSMECGGGMQADSDQQASQEHGKVLADIQVLQQHMDGNIHKFCAARKLISLTGGGTKVWETLQTWVGLQVFQLLGAGLRQERPRLSGLAQAVPNAL